MTATTQPGPQFLGRAGGTATARAGARASRARRLPRHRHVGDGDESPLGTRSRAIIGEAEANLRKLVGHPRRLRHPLPPGGRHAPVRHASDEPASHRMRRPTTSSRATGRRPHSRRRRSSVRPRRLAPPKSTNFDRIPTQSELSLDPAAAYLHFTSNNTIYGTEWTTEPVPVAGVPLVCDASSDILSRPFDIKRYGVALRWRAEEPGPGRCHHRHRAARTCSLAFQATCPLMLDYRVMAENRSLYNTPPCFAIYVVGPRPRSGSSTAAASQRWPRTIERKARSALRGHRRQQRLSTRATLNATAGRG